MRSMTTRAPHRAMLVLGLCALLTLVSGVGAGIAASKGPTATAAKKKCKTKKRSAATAKKRCKRKRAIPLPGPLVRATIAWSQPVDVDLHAFDASGNHSGFAGGPGGSIIQGIPNATHSPDASAGGSETFTDNVFVQGGLTNREFSYIICFYGTADVTFTGVTSTGQSSTIPISDSFGFADSLSPPGGPPTPDPRTIC
jgi:hypothetical protein